MPYPLLAAAACLNLAAAVVETPLSTAIEKPGVRFSIRMDAPDGLPGEVPVVRSRSRMPALKLAPRARGPRSEESDAPAQYLVDLRDQLDFEGVAQLLGKASVSRKPQRAWVIDALAAVASRGQRRLRILLDELQRRGDVTSWTGMSIVNRLVVTARPSAIRALSESAEVDSIAPEIESETLLQADAEEPSAGPPPTWPLDAIGAREAWRSGLDGTGITVGVIDSGASNLHEQLRGNFRGGPASWFDPLQGSADPVDVQTGHGTSVLGCAVGQGQPDGPSGDAPGARWVAAVGLKGGRYDNVLVTRAADWMLNVAQPDVPVVAFRAPGTGCDEALRSIVEALRAAGIVVAFAAGNGGPLGRSDVSPANYADLFPGSSSALS